MVNTEKPMAKDVSKKELAAAPKVNSVDVSKAPVQKTEEKKPEVKEETKSEEKEGEKSVEESKQTKEKKEEIKKKQSQQLMVKKSEALVNGFAIPISTKQAKAICKFIKGKRIGDAIRDLEDVVSKKKYVPMSGEIAHRKGPGKYASGSGKYPKNASEHFIRLLKTLAGNSVMNNMDEPVISIAMANIAARPFGKGGRVRKKRSHIKIIATEKSLLKKNKKKLRRNE